MRVTRSGDWKIPSTRTPQASGAAPDSGLGLVREPSQAAILLQHPLRLKYYSALLEPDSCHGCSAAHESAATVRRTIMSANWLVLDLYSLAGTPTPAPSI